MAGFDQARIHKEENRLTNKQNSQYNQNVFCIKVVDK